MKATFSVATVVDKPLTVDMMIRSQTRPNCAKVKVEVDLTIRLPQRVRIIEEDDNIGETKYKWIQYDHTPKYFNEYCFQGHDESSY